MFILLGSVYPSCSI
jgi:hypothetical protein